MKVVERKLGNGRVELIATATVEEVDAVLNDAQIKFAQDMNLRPDRGKVVSQLAYEQLGIRDLDSVVQHQAAERLVPFALDKRDLCPALRPEPHSATALERGKKFKFTVEVVPKPRFELSSYEPVRVVVPPFSYDEEEADRQVARIVERFAEFPVLKSRRAVKATDHCFIALKATVDGEEAPQLSTEGRVYSLGQGFMPASFDEALIGMKKGETRTVEFDAAKPDPQDAQATGHYVCEVTLLELRKKVVPKLADEWVAEHIDGQDTVEGMRAAIDAQVQAQARAAYNAQVRGLAVAELATRMSGQVPVEIFRNTCDTVRADLVRTVTAQGEDFASYVERMGGPQLVDQAISERALQLLAQDYALDSLFAHEDLEIEEEDYLSACLEIGPEDPQGTRANMEATGRGFALREVASRHRAARWLLETAQLEVVEPEPAKPKAKKRAAAKKPAAKKKAAKED